MWHLSEVTETLSLLSKITFEKHFIEQDDWQDWMEKDLMCI